MPDKDNEELIAPVLRPTPMQDRGKLFGPQRITFSMIFRNFFRPSWLSLDERQVLYDASASSQASHQKNDAFRFQDEPPDRLIENVDYYLEDGLFVFTEHYLRKRGYCCKSGCRHCPYGFQKPTEEE